MLLPRLIIMYAALVEAPPSMGGMCYWNAGNCGPDGAGGSDWKRQKDAFLRQGKMCWAIRGQAR
ncbi:MAG: hypothetical protein ACN6QE_09910, partial [Pseudomonas putida]